MRTASVIIALTLLPLASAADPCVSGLAPGQRPGPYSFLVATGPQRGQQTCYVCETAERPAIVIFARKLTPGLEHVLVKCDDLVAGQAKDTVFAWMTVLGEKTVSLDDLAKWGKAAGLKGIPLGVFDDPVGPPSYKLNADAEVTVLLYNQRKVLANFAFRAGELNDEGVKKIAAALPRLIEKK
jgi:hypothetical protein